MPPTGDYHVSMIPGFIMLPKTERVADLFAAVQALPEAEQPAFLDQACADDQEVKDQVEQLLRAFAQAKSFLEPHPRNETGKPLTPLGASDTWGPYRLLEKLGEGGMGEVWLAQQEHPVKRQVAVKIIKAGMDSKQVLDRFGAERRSSCPDGSSPYRQGAGRWD